MGVAVKIAFLGYGEIGASVLQPLAAHHEVAVAVTHRQDFAGLGDNDVAPLAEWLGLPMLLARNAGEPHVVDTLDDIGPDVLVSANWRTKVPENVLRIPSYYPINIHDALLPDYAGFGSVNWSIRNGETKIGLTVHVMERELDTGPILHTLTVPIGPLDTATTVTGELLKNYPDAVLTALDLIVQGAQPTPQPPGGSFYHRITEVDTRIDWTEPTTRLLNLVRAQSDPFINAWCLSDGHKLHIKSATRPSRPCRGTPGYIATYTDGGVAVVCGPSWQNGTDGIVLLDVAQPGQAARPAAEILAPGMRLT
ncbi:MAG: methionyl-tRNA formyltransferase [Pseudonocardiaceae bacterium]